MKTAKAGQKHIDTQTPNITSEYLVQKKGNGQKKEKFITALFTIHIMIHYEINNIKHFKLVRLFRCFSQYICLNMQNKMLLNGKTLCPGIEHGVGIIMVWACFAALAPFDTWENNNLIEIKRCYK